MWDWQEKTGFGGIYYLKLSYATSRKVAGSIFDEVVGFFN
jgi:hypothetical protein